MATKLPKGRDVRFLSAEQLGLKRKKKGKPDEVPPKGPIADIPDNPHPPEAIQSEGPDLSEVLGDFTKSELGEIAEYYEVEVDQSWRKDKIISTLVESDADIPTDRDTLSTLLA